MPEIRVIPDSTMGMASSVRGAGFSPRSSQAANATITTWRLPSTVASPAPTHSMLWCQKTTSAAKNRPASAVIRTAAAGSGPCRRSSSHATRASSGRPYSARKTAPVSGVTAASR